jgi:hypothetical protein
MWWQADWIHGGRHRGSHAGDEVFVIKGGMADCVFFVKFFIKNNGDERGSFFVGETPPLNTLARPPSPPPVYLLAHPGWHVPFCHTKYPCVPGPIITGGE